MRIACAVISEVFLRDIGCKDHGLRCEQAEACEKLCFFLVLGLVGPCGLSVLEQILELSQKIHFLSECLVGCSGLGSLGDPLLDHFEVCKGKLEVDGLDITYGIYASVDMDDVTVLKASNDMNDRIRLSDVRKELVTESLTLGCALNKSGDINELYNSMNGRLRVIHLGEYIKPLVRYGYDSHVGVDRTERVVGRLRSCLCK